MNRKLKLLQDIKQLAYNMALRSKEDDKTYKRELEFIRTWVTELEGYEQAMIKALEPYLAEGS